jgi:regulator of sigma E protease
MHNIFSNPAVAMLIMLGSLVLFHELGHYLMGRWCGVAIEKFSIGFGHRIAAFRRGQTDYLIGWIPLGGYVKFYGSTRNEDVPEGVTGILFWKAALWKRALIVAAGPFANFLLAFLIFWGMVMHGIEHPPALVGDVIEGGRAQQAGILPGDRFIEVAGTPIKSWQDIERIFQKNPDQPLKMIIDRKGALIEKLATPEAVVGRSLFGAVAKIGRLGVALGYPSAVVTSTSQGSPIAQDGLKTGDRLESWTDAAGVSHKIHGLHETFALFAEWSRSGVPEIKVSVRPVAIVDDAQGHPIERGDPSVRDITLHVGKWPKVGTESDRAYAASLGAADSHLTIGKARGKAADVLKPGDRLIVWGDQPINNIFHLQEIMESWKTAQVSLRIMRDYKEMTVQVALNPIEIQLPEGAVTFYSLDVSMLGQTTTPDPEIRQEGNPIKAAGLAFSEAYDQTSVMVTALWRIVTGATPIKALGGPMMIAKVAGDSAKAGGLAFLATMAVISINLGLVNLFPIPVLDGGQLVLLGVEGVKRSPISEATVENFQKIGFVMVMSLVVIALYNDLSRFWGSMIGSIFGSK